MAPSGLLLIGKVIRPHGLRGTLRVMFYVETKEIFEKEEHVFLRLPGGGIDKYSITSLVSHKNYSLLALKEIDSRHWAERLRGAEILVRKEAIPRRSEGEYFWDELLGIRVFLDSGEFLGNIFQVIPTGANDIYVVKTKDKEILIPGTYEVVKEVNTEKEWMIVSPMEGLLDLNEV